ALAATLSSYGLHEYFVSAPALREAYDKDPERMLRERGISAERGSPERMLFENRLQGTEPMATFALANSLAGVLAPWLVVTAGLALLFLRGDGAGDRRRAITLVGLTVLAGLMAACLLLTKSRSAWIAGAAGLAWLAVSELRRGRQASWRWLFAGLALLGLVAVGVAVAGSFDRKLLTEAAKSFGYRWQYWQSSLAMIADHPWFGCGPGNFQDEYTLYKLPEASEVVADPHNFLMEVWATAGTPALVAFLGIFAGAAYDLFRRRTRQPALKDDDASAGEAAANIFWVLVGGVLGGFALAVVIGLSATVPFSEYAFGGGLAVMAAALALLYPWIEHGTLPPALPLVGAAVMAVNLLAAGGIGFPGVAGSLWVLLGLGLCLSAQNIPRRSLSKPAAICAIGFLFLVLGAFVWGDYLPVMNARLRLLQAEASEINLARQQETLKAAAAADRLWEKPWRYLAALEFSRWQRQHDRAALDRWQKATNEAARRRPHSAIAREQAADAWLEVYGQTGRPDDLRQAAGFFQQAVELYPNHAETRGKLAAALAALGEQARARKQAEKALRLDETTPHDDQKLPPKLRAAMRDIVAASETDRD
ncbi:MAG TPA: O-antigen ligase family protein, partial [Pirellulales bacterium]|nr:O-antigen ligase family protein [Pirellulales bacterium]